MIASYLLQILRLLSPQRNRKKSSLCLHNNSTYSTLFWGNQPMLTSQDSAKISHQSSSLYHTMWRRESTTLWAFSCMRMTKRWSMAPSFPIPPGLLFTTRIFQTTPWMWFKPSQTQSIRPKLRITNSLPPPNVRPNIYSRGHRRYLGQQIVWDRHALHRRITVRNPVPLASFMRWPPCLRCVSTTKWDAALS